MLLVSRKDWLTLRLAGIFPMYLYVLHVVLVSRCQGLTKLNNIKGIGFQKEHDGSIVGMENGVQQIHITGIQMHLYIYIYIYIYILWQLYVLMHTCNYAWVYHIYLRMFLGKYWHCEFDRHEDFLPPKYQLDYRMPDSLSGRGCLYVFYRTP